MVATVPGTITPNRSLWILLDQLWARRIPLDYPSIIFATVIGITNYAVYKSSIDYMIAAYGPFAASTTRGNDCARDFLAGIAALWAHSFYENIGNGEYHLIYPSTILACLGVVIIIPIYIFYKIRLKSKFAQELEVARRERLERKRERKASAAGDLAEEEGSRSLEHGDQV